MEVDEPITVVDYDPSWPAAAEAELERLARALAPLRASLEHIGSTAVPGCAAKPIVDLLAGTEPGDRELVEAALVEAGYESLGEAAPGRIYLRRRHDRDFNVHVVERDGELWADNLALRDHLRAHPDERDRYAEAKRRAAAATPTLLAYSRAKSATIDALLRRAR
jgi:GrpB-like predicted nucleotidyltransferase (UPF0157 family)